jgi:hypothetical protein
MSFFQEITFQLKSSTYMIQDDARREGLATVETVLWENAAAGTQQYTTPGVGSDMWNERRPMVFGGAARKDPNGNPFSDFYSNLDNGAYRSNYQPDRRDRGQDGRRCPPTYRRDQPGESADEA